MILSIISAIGNNNEIGKSNTLLWNLPVDMKHFRETTTGHPVIMGQKTFESIGRPLPNRWNVVLSKDKNFQPNHIRTVHTLEELDALLGTNVGHDEEAFIIGGGQIYKLFIEKADRLHVTHVDSSFPEADTFFPEIDKTKWKIISEEKHLKDEKNPYDCNFVVYEKIK